MSDVVGPSPFPEKLNNCLRGFDEEGARISEGKGCHDPIGLTTSSFWPGGGMGSPFRRSGGRPAAMMP